MTSLKDVVVFVTGASSGIGRSCARYFAMEGARVILAARRIERLELLKKELKENYDAESLAVLLDVRNHKMVQKVVRQLPGEWSKINLLVNNAGLSRGLTPFYEGRAEDWNEMIDTNIKGLLAVTRAIIPGMIDRGRGHVINIGSIAGREVYPRGHVYCATKFAVRALTQGIRMDLINTPVRVSEVAPGLVKTEFSLVRFRGDKERAAKTYAALRPLEPDDIAEAVIFCATRPPHVTINQIVVMPSEQASIMVHR